MSLQTLNEYQALNSQNTSLVMVAASLSEAATELEAAGANTLLQISQTKALVQVYVPDAAVNFAAVVSPAAAAAVNCAAYPTAFNAVPGTLVVFQAVAPAACGYVFSGWYRGTTLLSSNAIAEIAIAAPPTGQSVDTIIATFVAG